MNLLLEIRSDGTVTGSWEDTGPVRKTSLTYADQVRGRAIYTEHLIQYGEQAREVIDRLIGRGMDIYEIAGGCHADTKTIRDIRAGQGCMRRTLDKLRALEGRK